jgi:CRP-like cAMP-binding protein
MAALPAGILTMPSWSSSRTHNYYEQGDPANSFFIVLKGKIEVVIDEQQLTGAAEPEDTPRRAASRPRSEAENKAGGLIKGYGETFGVASLVLDAPVRQYGMRTTERCLFIRIAFDDFRPTL